MSAAADRELASYRPRFRTVRLRYRRHYADPSTLVVFCGSEVGDPTTTSPLAPADCTRCVRKLAKMNEAG